MNGKQNSTSLTTTRATQQISRTASNDFVFRLRIYKANRIKKPPKLNTKEEDVKELIE